ncbi:hypothetical protein BDW02DRAFT_510821, partial [Decorospora gaudefroyi]
NTYNHRILKTALPVRSAVLKQDTGGLVVRWVTTSASPLLYVLFFFLHVKNLAERRAVCGLVGVLVGLGYKSHARPVYYGCASTISSISTRQSFKIARSGRVAAGELVKPKQN